jgi:DNA mismatch endonuclease (patch repair protein)
MDIWDGKKRSEVMSKIRSQDTKPELIVRRYLWSRGYRYRKNLKKLPGTPDIVLRKYGVVIFIHGCFWHGHGHRGTPSTNSEFWSKKISRNKQRDEEVKQKLQKMGWAVMTIWECQLKPSVRQNTLSEMERLINALWLKKQSIRKKTKSYSLEENEGELSIAAEPVIEYGGKNNDTN